MYHRAAMLEFQFYWLKSLSQARLGEANFSLLWPYAYSTHAAYSHTYTQQEVDCMDLRRPHMHVLDETY